MENEVTRTPAMGGAYVEDVPPLPPSEELEALAAAPSPPPSSISFVGASRWYGQVIGVNDITADIEPGITALLGPNGAGKSTLMRMAMGLIRPSQGQVRVLGEDPWNNPELMRRIGYVAPGAPAWSHLTAREAVERAARLCGSTESAAPAAAQRALDSVGLGDDDPRPTSSFSHGMQQRLKLAMATVHNPLVLILDEPLLGTDPIVRQSLLQRMRDLARSGCAILLSTHVLSDVEALTDRLMLVHHGRLLGHGTVSHIRDLLDRHPRTVRITATQPQAIAAELLSWDSVESVQKEPGAVVVRTRAAAEFFPRLQERIAAGDLDVESVATLDDNVEAVVRYLVEVGT